MNKQLEFLIERYPALSVCKDDIEKAYEILEECFATGHKLLIAGNGGSCSDGEHIAGELMKGFKLQRKCSEKFAERVKSIESSGVEYGIYQRRGERWIVDVCSAGIRIRKSRRRFARNIDFGK